MILCMSFLTFKMLIRLNYDYRNKHSGFSTTFPIYLWHTYEDVVPVEDTSSMKSSKDKDGETDDDEALVEDVSDDDGKEPETKKVTVEEWMHINPMPPVWMRCASTLCLRVSILCPFQGS